MQRREFVKTFTMGAVALSALGQTAEAQPRTFLTQQQALQLALPGNQKVARQDVTLSADQIKAVEHAIGVRLGSTSQTIFRGESGYAMILHEIGKEQYITFIVGVTSDFRVRRVALMVFRETRGWEVDDERFTRQFVGKTLNNRISVGSDIVAVTGATLSSRAFCRGARKALAICKAVYG